MHTIFLILVIISLTKRDLINEDMYVLAIEYIHVAIFEQFSEQFSTYI